MATDKIIRKAKNRENPYSMIANALINDSRLSFKARGIMTYILSKPDDWVIYVSQLCKETTDGRESVETGIDELRYFGYVELVCIRNDKGRVESWEYVVYEEPIEVSEEERAKIHKKRTNKRAREQRKADKRKQRAVEIENVPEPGKPDLDINPETGSPDLGKSPETGSPDLGSPEVGNPQLLNTDPTNKEIEQNTDRKTTTKEAIVVNDEVNSLSTHLESILGQPVTSIVPLLEGWLREHEPLYIIRRAMYVKTYQNPVGALRRAIDEKWDIPATAEKEISATSNEKDERYKEFYKHFPDS